MYTVRKEKHVDDRAHLPAVERAARSRLVQLLSSEPLLCGTAVRMARTCGSKSCRCTRGYKHVSLYLAIRAGDRRKMVYVPPEWEENVRQWVKNYQEVSALMKKLSQSGLAQMEQWKKQRREERLRGRRVPRV